MVKVVNVLGYSLVLSIMVLFAYVSFYFLIFLSGKVLKRKLLNNTLLKIIYILTSLPFFLCGLYVIGLAFVIDYVVFTKILVIIFGLFLVIYSTGRVVIKIKDIDYFGGV